ncbi:MAG: DUF2306 domain-containing protein [Rickettsiaceae bacterium H1]|nr:DUF2306 domain-containing protein [Rickettsiaceae bacterium H1]
MIIEIHLFTAVLAIILGVVNLMARKGNLLHRLIGSMWAALMTITIISSFFIREVNHGSFSSIHLLSFWTTISLSLGIFYIKKHNVKKHSLFMIGTMIGVIIAGLFAFTPGRYLSIVLGYYN